MSDLHQTAGFPRAQAGPQPGHTADQRPRLCTPDARTKSPHILKEITAYATEQPVGSRAGPC